MAVLRPQKAVHVFLEAAPLVLERVPDAQLAVVGDGDLREELERRAGELGVADRVRFLRFLPPASRQLASVDVFVLPSAWEAFPISVLEAMACGVPTVATDVGGTAEALDDGVTGLLCPPGDPPALADRVARLLGDPSLRERMGEAARARHASLFTLERMVAETVALYDAVHARGG
jgi:glycosyltransferase involved in cell wall biosynthesis